MPTLPPSFPPIDALIETLSAVDWKRTAHRALMVAATVLAVVVAVSSWLWRSGRQFWSDHGATITAATKTAATRTAALTVAAWQLASPALARTANRAADSVFHWLADGRPMPFPLLPVRMAL